MGGLGVGGLGFESQTTPKYPNPFGIRGSQESKPPGPKPPIITISWKMNPPQKKHVTNDYTYEYTHLNKTNENKTKSVWCVCASFF